MVSSCLCIQSYSSHDDEGSDSNSISSAADEISGETVAIKLVTRIFDKIQLAKRALREITLLRHFSNHENITGLIDVDAISPDFNEIYIFMEVRSPILGYQFMLLTFSYYASLWKVGCFRSCHVSVLM